ncbi:helix-turn-helix transcriptional regulator [Pelagibaculum spongiae]|uniref:WYL domain-containing protein n=1 Tax=Pelagibaculum spongiae TaxID=2080658 RepID=A0A2V1GXP0_9GAMM|nr:WYL domain-containing protein [Pelagibaculum spongiae]PVZ69768.1 WYL domain-containing protein [Pelagibaculum spongiae]
MPCLDKHHYQLQLIEMLLKWQGQLNSSDLTEKLSISRQSASALIKQYKSRYPQNMFYDNQRKTYLACDQFKEHLSCSNLSDYCHQFMPEQVVDRQPSSNDFGHSVVLHGLQRNVQPHNIRPILQAIRQQQRIDIQYASLSNPQFNERIISPHSLIFDGQRWHVRAWCEKRKAFRDFVLSRIQQIHYLEGPSQHGSAEDKQWNQLLELEIIPDQRLDPQRQAIIALDYAMQKDASGQHHKVIHIRAALLIYHINQMRLKGLHDHPQIQQITLSSECRQRLQPWWPN